MKSLNPEKKEEGTLPNDLFERLRYGDKIKDCFDKGFTDKKTDDFHDTSNNVFRVTKVDPHHENNFKPVNLLPPRAGNPDMVLNAEGWGLSVYQDEDTAIKNLRKLFLNGRNPELKERMGSCVSEISLSSDFGLIDDPVKGHMTYFPVKDLFLPDLILYSTLPIA